jgi:hypothetical protein
MRVRKEESVGFSQDNRAVGNSRLAHMDVLSVSWEKPTDSSLETDSNRVQDALRRMNIPNEFGPTQL